MRYLPLGRALHNILLKLVGLKMYTIGQNKSVSILAVGVYTVRVIYGALWNEVRL